MRQLDPAAGPVERFASELRALRALAGDLTFARMGRRCAVSKSALAAAAAGRELPSEHVTREFVRACGGDWSWWQARWLQASADAAPDAAPENACGDADDDADAAGAAHAADAADAAEPGRGVLAIPQGKVLSVLREQLAVPAQDRSPVRPIPPCPGAAGGVRRPFRPTWWGVAAAAALAAVVTTAALETGARARSTPQAAARSPRPPAAAVSDGTDPQAVGCSADKTTLETRAVLLQGQAQLRGRHLAAGTQVGTISLVYSPHCAGAWARFYPTPGLNPDPNDTTVGITTVEADRPADNTQTLWKMGHIDETYSGILLTGIGCVVARARVEMVGQNVAAVGETRCLPQRAGTSAVPGSTAAAGGSGT